MPFQSSWGLFCDMPSNWNSVYKVRGWSRIARLKVYPHTYFRSTCDHVDTSQALSRAWAGGGGRSWWFQLWRVIFICFMVNLPPSSYSVTRPTHHRYFSLSKYVFLRIGIFATCKVDIQWPLCLLGSAQICTWRYNLKPDSNTGFGKL